METEKVTLTLPRDLMNSVRTLAPSRGHSKFIAEAIQYFIVEQKRRERRKRLIAGYQANAEADTAIALEWEPLEAEAWLDNIPPYPQVESSYGTNDTAR